MRWNHVPYSEVQLWSFIESPRPVFRKGEDSWARVTESRDLREEPATCTVKSPRDDPHAQYRFELQLYIFSSSSTSLEQAPKIRMEIFTHKQSDKRKPLTTSQRKMENRENEELQSGENTSVSSSCSNPLNLVCVTNPNPQTQWFKEPQMQDFLSIPFHLLLSHHIHSLKQRRELGLLSACLRLLV